MQSWKLDFPVKLLVLQNIKETRHKIIKVLIHARLHASREVGNDATCQLDTVIILGLECIFDVASDVSDIDVAVQAHYHSLECNDHSQLPCPLT